MFALVHRTEDLWQKGTIVIKVLSRNFTITLGLEALLTPYEKVIRILPNPQGLDPVYAMSECLPRCLHSCSCADDLECFFWRTSTGVIRASVCIGASVDDASLTGLSLLPDSFSFLFFFRSWRVLFGAQKSLVKCPTLSQL